VQKIKEYILISLAFVTMILGYRIGSKTAGDTYIVKRNKLFGDGDITIKKAKKRRKLLKRNGNKSS